MKNTQIGDTTRTLVKGKGINNQWNRPFISTEQKFAKEKQALGAKNDCTVLATAAALNIGYNEAFKMMEALGRPAKDGFDFAKVLRTMVKSNGKKKLGGKKVTEIDVIYNPYDPRRTCNRFREDYPKGSLILIVTGHALAVVDGVMMDGSFHGRRQVKAAFKIG